MSLTGKKLSYQPYSSILNPGFWQQLTNVKLNKLKLSTEAINIRGTYSHGLSNNLPCLASFDHSSFDEDLVDHDNRTSCPIYGRMICFNLLQEMVDFDKKTFVDLIGDEIWSSILDGRALKDPERHLSKFGLLVFADLKKYIFTYWFVFPALNYPLEVYDLNFCNNEPERQRPITDKFSQVALKSFQEQYDAPQSKRNFQRGYFILVHDEKNDIVVCSPMSCYEEMRSHYLGSMIYFAFSDPCSSDLYPGWPLRNFLALITKQFQLDTINIIRVRRAQQMNDNDSIYSHSFLLEIQCDLKGLSSNQLKRPVITGWEKNESQQLAPKRVNLSNLLDPTKLATDAVNLNLKLMKWRLLPSLDLDKIAETRCLLLGCGTLGCHIARGLLAWGIKSISLVDNSKISYSNPVRQTLYTFEDCLGKEKDASGAGLYKAKAAAANLRKIHPTVDVKPHIMSIPMPGHHVSQNEEEQTRDIVSRLEKLIDDHDVIFLLMDTRESRWLPTVIAMAKQKLVINAAIGFDTFLLQRFGIRDYSKVINETRELACSSVLRQQQLDSSELSCYFCNDIVAPGDSTLDRTLDQQCTVSRPGVSMMVSAMAVEFFASISSSRLGSRTPAPVDTQHDLSMMSDEHLGSDLGLVPHSIRGNMSLYHIYMPTSPRFEKCAACSDAVVGKYLEEGYDFLLRVFNEPAYLEELAGLKELKNVSDDVWILESDSSDEINDSKP